MTLRIAMWSGPRNISTAMMRAWENRPDTAVWDEPFYGHYLSATGLDHPGAADITAAGGTDWQVIANACAGPAPNDRAVFFQKHMTHHMLDHIDRGWMADVVNCFLIRRPDEVLSSYLRSRPSATAEDIGFIQQAELVGHADALQGNTIILESSEVLANPERVLRTLCAHLGIAFDDAMLSWPAGKRDTDGVWGPHWYDAVWASTEFMAYRPKEISIPHEFEPIVAECQPYYDELYARRLRP